MSILLTEEQQLIAQSAREFARECLAPIAAELDHAGAFPEGSVRRMAAQDFLGLVVAEAHGGAGAGFVSLVQTLEQMSQASAAVASILVGHTLAAFAIQRWGSPAQRQKFLPGMASGRDLGAFAAFEDGPRPGVGPRALQAAHHPEGWVLNGAKAYVRNAGVAQVLVVTACTDPGTRSMAAFIVPAGTLGLAVGEPLETMGLKGCPVAGLTFDHVFLPDSALLAGDGQAITAQTLAVAAVAEAAQAVGLGQAALHHAAAYAKTRIQFGHPIAGLQAIQALLAETATTCHLARLGMLQAADLIDRGEPFEVEAAMLRQFLARFGTRMLVDTVQVEGGFGYSESMPLPRLFRDLAGVTLLDAPADFPDAIIARNLLA